MTKGRNRAGGRIVVDGRPIEFAEGDSVAIAIIRAGEVPGRGGAICLAGDCGNCLAAVDGVAYVRTCQVPPQPGMVVERQLGSGKPPLPSVELGDLTRPPVGERIPVRRADVDLVIAGQAEAGNAAGEAARSTGRAVVFLDAQAGQEVVAIYPGPSVVVREPGRMTHLRADEVVVATGAAELQPVCEGSDLAGILTPKAAERLGAAGVDLGRVERVGRELIRFEGDDRGRVSAVVTRAPDGSEMTTECDTVVVDLGRAPRDVLARMSRDDAVRVVGSAADDHPLPPAPTAGVVCPCMGTTVDDLETAFAKGYSNLELLKRASWAGLGPCQGGACLPHVRAFIAARTGSVPDPFT
ncbi:MAG TPA: 2Fe-2S iron-sulfur cluster-binding protein, partial [Candidatus Limnocylindrales bacterium]|nr:2Fe-2S iron-sulfur cluster-binding protein [Candidatus Limnocylindrales bacterium]